MWTCSCGEKFDSWGNILNLHIKPLHKQGEMDHKIIGFINQVTGEIIAKNPRSLKSRTRSSTITPTRSSTPKTSQIPTYTNVAGFHRIVIKGLSWDFTERDWDYFASVYHATQEQLNFKGTPVDMLRNSVDLVVRIFELKPIGFYREVAYEQRAINEGETEVIEAESQ